MIFRKISALIRYRKDLGTRAALNILRHKFTPSPVYKIHVRGIRTPVYFRPGTNDLAILQQILGERELDVAFDVPPRMIVDAGANVGYSSLFFANRYPHAHILSVEPEPSNCELFNINCRGYSNVSLVRGAVWPRKSKLQIANPEAKHDAFRVIEDPNASQTTVDAYTVGDLMNLANVSHIDLLKIDIEGAEKELFEGDSRDWLSRVDVLMVELHDRFKPGCTNAMHAALQGSGRQFRTSSQGEYLIVRLI